MVQDTNIDANALQAVVEGCTALETLDVRACAKVSDKKPFLLGMSLIKFTSSQHCNAFYRFHQKIFHMFERLVLGLNDFSALCQSGVYVFINGIDLV